jgi:hypothetical protein
MICCADRDLAGIHRCATATGRNEHALQRGFTIGASWSFGRKSAMSRITSSAPGTVTAKRQASLTKCIYQNQESDRRVLCDATVTIGPAGCDGRK